MKLFVKRGDSTNWIFQVYDGSTYRDLTSDFVRFTVKNAVSDLDSEAVLRLSSTTSGVTILDQSIDPPTGTKGQFTVTLLHTDTRDFEANRACVWDVQMTLADGSVVTPFQGTIVFDGDVTFNSGSIATDL